VIDSENQDADQGAKGTLDAKTDALKAQGHRRKIRYILQKKINGQWENHFLTADLSAAANMIKYTLINHFTDGLRLYQYDENSLSQDKDAKGLFHNIVTNESDLFNVSHDSENLQPSGHLDDAERKDFSDRDLSGLDFSGQDFSGANFNRSRLVGALLKGCLLRNATFIDANLSHADLTDSDATGADFSCANLSNAKLVKADLTAACLMRAEVYSADMTGAVTKGGHLGVRHIIPAAASLVGLIDPGGYS
jgi:uncharacterized protein YjbI with pentapeptide repeats